MSFQRFINPTRRSNSSLGPIASGRVPIRQVIPRGQPRGLTPHQIRAPIAQYNRPVHTQRVLGGVPISNSKRLEDLQAEKNKLLQKLQDNERLEREIKEKAEIARKKKEEEELENVRKEMERLQNSLKEKEMQEKWIREKNEQERQKKEERDMQFLQLNRDKIKQQIQEYEETAVKIRETEELSRIKKEKIELERRWAEVREAELQKKRIESAELKARQKQESERQMLERLELDRIEKETQQLREQLRNKSQTEEWLEKRLSQERAENDVAEAIRRQKKSQQRGKPIIRTQRNKLARNRVKRTIQSVPTQVFQYPSDNESTDDISHMLPRQDELSYNHPEDTSGPLNREETLSDEDEAMSMPTISDISCMSGDVKTDRQPSSENSGEYSKVLERIAKDIQMSRQDNVLGKKEADSLQTIFQACKNIEAKQIPIEEDHPITREEAEHIHSSNVDFGKISGTKQVIPEQIDVDDEEDSNIAELNKTMKELKSALHQSNPSPATNPLRDIKTPSSCLKCNLNK